MARVGRPFRYFEAARALPIGLAVLFSGCADDAEDTGTLPDCIVVVPSECDQLYPAQWQEVWDNTLAISCTSQGSACHASEDASGAAGGLVLRDPAEAHDLLTAGDEPYVVPGDSACSPLFVRLATDDPNFRMPPGADGVDERALCSIAAWIDEGAAP